MTTKYIELHLIQNFAPSCLNRDDTNTPKDCEFGGVRRARISSQCLKRAIRNQFKEYFEEKDIGKRTRQVKYLIEDKLIEKGKEDGVDIVSEHCGSRLRNLLVGGEKTVIHIGIDETDKIVDVILNNWDEVLKHAEKKKKLPDKIEKEFVSICEEHSKNIDIALFGRMMASKPKANQDASCQVAHAISTHAVSLEWDFYTAVDERSPEEETGAGMMGVIGYDSACFYRYSLLDIEQLLKNLKGDKEKVQKTVSAFIASSIDAIPPAKQNSFAAHNPPSFVLAVIREKGMPYSLANAFEKPASPDTYKKQSLVENSISKLDEYWKWLNTAYGNEGVALSVFFTEDKLKLDNFSKEEKVKGKEELIKKVMDNLKLPEKE